MTDLAFSAAKSPLNKSGKQREQHEPNQMSSLAHEVVLPTLSQALPEYHHEALHDPKQAEQVHQAVLSVDEAVAQAIAAQEAEQAQGYQNNQISLQQAPHFHLTTNNIGEAMQAVGNLVGYTNQHDLTTPHTNITSKEGLYQQACHLVHDLILPTPPLSLIPVGCTCGPHHNTMPVAHSMDSMPNVAHSTSSTHHKLAPVSASVASVASVANSTVSIPVELVDNDATKLTPTSRLFSLESDSVLDEEIMVDSHDELALKTKLLATLGWRMASCGAETRLIVQSVKKMAHDLGCRNVELSISRDGILVKLRRGHQVSVEFKEVKHFAINMDSLARLHQICLRVSDGTLSDPKQIFLAIRAVRPRHYNHNHIIFIEAIAGACFAYLNGGNTNVCAAALIGGIFLMFSRFLFIKRGFFESFTFMLSAWIGSLVAGLICLFGFHSGASEVILSATATTLLLVPGFPLINGFLDIFKGYVPIGLTRLVIAGVLVVSSSIGLLTSHFILRLLMNLFPYGIIG